MANYFKYCEANNQNVQKSYHDGKRRIGYEDKRFDCPEEAEKEGYTRLLHNVKPLEKKAPKKRVPKPKKAEAAKENNQDDDQNG